MSKPFKLPAQQAATPPAVQAQDAKYAARYRWLRLGKTMPLDMCGCCQLQGDDLDAEIDAQMSAAAAAQGDKL